MVINTGPKQKIQTGKDAEIGASRQHHACGAVCSAYTRHIYYECGKREGIPNDTLESAHTPFAPNSLIGLSDVSAVREGC